MGMYRDGDALAFDGSSRGGEAYTNHVAKRKKVDKGQDVVFDDNDRKSYLTGFRKRKLQRRKEALKRMESRAKSSKLVERAERRQQFKDELGLPENYGVENSSDDEPDKGDMQQGTEGGGSLGDVKVYDFGNVTTTVTTVALDSDDGAGNEGTALDSDGSDEGGEGTGNDLEHGMALPKKGIPSKQAGRKKANKANKDDAKKMEALRALIAGKRVKSKKGHSKQREAKQGGAKGGKGAKKRKR